jgi:hypothetical protein
LAEPSETKQVSREPTVAADELVSALRSLAAQVGSLQTEVQSLRAESRGLPIGEADRHGWDETAPIVREGPAWIRSVDSPRPRGLAIPWLLLEVAFLVAIAVLAVVADLDPYAIAGVMAAAWALVAVAEWLAARGERSDRRLVYRAGTPPTMPQPDDTAWFAQNGGDTVLDEPSAERQPARLPPSD